MQTKRSTISISLPKLDYFDFFSIILWFTLLIPAFQFANNGTFTFLRSTLLLVLISIFSVIVAIKIYKEKRILFYSASWGNLSILLYLAVVLLSLFFSASRIDSLFGYDLSFAASSLVVISLIWLYFLLKTAGLTLELNVSRVFSLLPTMLVISMFISVIAFLIPQSTYQSIFGDFSSSIQFVKASPLALLGPVTNIIVVSLFAIVINAQQLVATISFPLKFSFELSRKVTTLAIISVSTSYLVFSTIDARFFTNYSAIFIIVLASLVVFFVINNVKSTHSTKLIYTLLAAGISVLALGIIWSRLGLVGKNPTYSMDSTESVQILKSSFLNNQIPLWREFVGYGTSTYPYLFLQHRTVEISQRYGNQTYFFKPNSLIEETFSDNGILGLLALSAIFALVLISFVKASSRKNLLQEFILFIILVANFTLLPSSLMTLVLLFVTLASYYDKSDSLPENLPATRAIDIRESHYTNKSVSRTGLVILISSALISTVILSPLLSLYVTISDYTKSGIELVNAQSKSSTEKSNAAESYSKAFEIAKINATTCKECHQLEAIKVNSLLGLRSLYNDLSEEEQAKSTELMQINTLLLSTASSLLSKTTSQFANWLLLGQAYRALAESNNSTTLYTISVQSIRNSIANNPLNIEAHFLYIDTLLNLGNSVEINNAIAESIYVLKQVIGNQIQVNLMEGILLAREGKYTESIDLFEKMKTEVIENTNITEDEKKSILDILNKRIEEVKEAELKTKPIVVPTSDNRDRQVE